MTVDCPHCNSVNSNPEIVGGMTRCAACEKWFKILSPSAAPNIALPQSERLEITARNFEAGARICVAFGIVALVLGFFSTLGPDAKGVSLFWVAMGALFGAAFCFYLLGQILHIRALLARK
jgi:hypothetical protein